MEGLLSLKIPSMEIVTCGYHAVTLGLQNSSKDQVCTFHQHLITLPHAALVTLKMTVLFYFLLL